MQTLIHTPAINIKDSLSFYLNLNFKAVLEQPFIVSDGKFAIEINPDKHARSGIKIIKESWDEEIKSLPETYPSFKIENGYLIRDNNGVWIYLIESKNHVYTIEDKENASHLGNFMGISIETTSVETSISFWNILGFTQVSGNIEQGWIVLANPNGFAVSFMLPLTCPHSFTNPSMTFFNSGKNLDNIAKIKSSNTPIKEEISAFNKEGIVDNIVIQDPIGYGMFIFND